ncbi:MAG: hypothetical protein KDA95_02845, partial [Acidimicrobiales bacterium]|nr:hypothetical protein [Acidimicrobiales bacterium]
MDTMQAGFRRISTAPARILHKRRQLLPYHELRDPRRDPRPSSVKENKMDEPAQLHWMKDGT